MSAAGPPRARPEGAQRPLGGAARSAVRGEPAAQRAAVALRGALVTFTGDPFVEGVAATCRHEPDAVVVVADGRVADCGAAADVLPRLPPGTK